jgi:MFS family permease
MNFFSNRDINYLTAHSALHKLAWGGYGVFSGVFLLHVGVPLADVFLVFTAIYFLRFIIRPMVGQSVRAFGIRFTLIFGTFLFALQFPALAFVGGADRALLLFCLVTAVATVYYWTCYHTVFAALGDAERRGSQVSARQALSAAAAIIGPALGGIMLAKFGPLAAFGAAAVIEVIAIIPLLRIKDFGNPISLSSKRFSAARPGALLFATDGWIIASSILAWNIIMFQALNTHFESLGFVFAAAALAGAIGGMLLGHFIDLGHTGGAIWLNGLILSGILIVKTFCGQDPTVVVFVAIGSTLLGGLYVPSLMTAFYNEAKASPSPLHFQLVSEGGWDVGGSLVCLLAFALLKLGAPIQSAIALALPAIIIQGHLLGKSYRKRLPVAQTDLKA